MRYQKREVGKIQKVKTCQLFICKHICVNKILFMCVLYVLFWQSIQKRRLAAGANLFRHDLSIIVDVISQAGTAMRFSTDTLQRRGRKRTLLELLFIRIFKPCSSDSAVANVNIRVYIVLSQLLKHCKYITWAYIAPCLKCVET